VRPLYGSFAWAYDLIVARPGGPAVEAVANAFRRRGAVRVVDAGCGMGHYSAALASAGLAMTGVDASTALVEQARARVPGVSFLVADLREWAPVPPSDGVLCRGVLNDFVSDEDRAAALRGLRAMLRPGGVLICDVRPWDQTLAHYGDEPVFERRASTERGELRFVSRTTPVARTRTLRVEERYSLSGIEDEEFSFTMRCWTPGELADGLRDAGFASIELPAPGLEPARPDRLIALATA
jgi:trans-aconitate methyltransferase